MKMKKKMMVTTLAAAMAGMLAACGGQESAAQTDMSRTENSIASETSAGTADGTTGSMEGDDTAAARGNGILIAYFSVMETDGVDTVGGASRVAVDGELLGNNQYVAQLIQQDTGGDLFEIQTVQEYPDTHDPLLEFAYAEKGENTRPELAARIENLDDYHTIFLGFPNWNADLPMPLYTFLEGHDLNGKTIIPFTVHGGSGFSRSIETIAGLQPEATVVSDGLSISRDRADSAKAEVTAWVEGLNLATQEPAAAAPENGSISGMTSAESAAASAGDSRSLVVYFSTPGLDGVDAVSRASANVGGDDVIGNTEYIAELVAETTGSERFRVETVKTYPEDIEELLEYAYEETGNEERPELATQLEHLEDYDIVYVGMPVWNYKMPMAMYSFFDAYDFSGKNIAVFTTHRGSGLSGIPEIIAELEPEANVLTDGFTVAGDDAVQTAGEEVAAWVDSLQW